MHFSVTQDAAEPLNLTHDYQVAFLETADFATHQYDVRRMGKGLECGFFFEIGSGIATG